MNFLSNDAKNDENDDSSVPQGPFSFLDKIIRDLLFLAGDVYGLSYSQVSSLHLCLLANVTIS
jgi:hypothetical protein